MNSSFENSAATHLTILHSNDIHGAFQPEEKDGVMTGGLALLSGYVKEARQENGAVYAVAGDLFRGSIIDSEFEGVSTIDLMNVLHPDVATVGNHEVDYGIAHLRPENSLYRYPDRRSAGFDPGRESDRNADRCRRGSERSRYHL